MDQHMKQHVDLSTEKQSHQELQCYQQALLLEIHILQGILNRDLDLVRHTSSVKAPHPGLGGTESLASIHSRIKELEEILQQKQKDLTRLSKKLSRSQSALSPTLSARTVSSSSYQYSTLSADTSDDMYDDGPKYDTLH